MMNHYEVVAIVAGTVSDEDLPKIQEDIHKELSGINAAIRSESSLGRRRLAYTIEKQQFGTYLVYQIDADAKDIATLERAFRLNPQIVRHLIVIEKVLTNEQKAARTALKERLQAKRAVAESKVAAEARTAETKPQETLSKEQLDKKLDTILEEDITID